MSETKMVGSRSTQQFVGGRYAGSFVTFFKEPRGQIASGDCSLLNNSQFLIRILEIPGDTNLRMEKFV